MVERKTDSKIDHAARLAAAIFAFQEWTYGGGDGHIPERAELAETLQYLLEHAVVGSRRTGTGRFLVEWNEDFQCYELMLILGNLSARELYEETGIDRRVGE